MDYFDAEWERIKAIEGPYSDNPNDPGGPTMYGVTEREARADGYTGPMQELPESRAKAMARRKRWERLALDDIANLSLPVARELFDSGYNCGVETAAKWLQEALNIFNRGGRDYAEVPADGAIGAHTLTALAMYFSRRGGQGQAGEVVLMRALNCQQGAYYLSIGKSRPQFEDFEFGWFLNRVT